jgi:DNA-binding GntR family transcriptional regulator
VLSRTLPTQVADHVRELILDGKLAPGERIIETDLAAELGVSRHTLRSALQTLTSEGLLEQSQFKSTHVTRPTARGVYETYTLRNALEAMACRLAAERALRVGMPAVDQAVTRMRKAAKDRDTEAMKAADFDFHVAVVDLADHALLREHFQKLHAQTRLYLNLTSSYHYELDVIAQIHADLADAIRAGDAHHAERLGAAHNTTDGEALCARLAEVEALSSGQARGAPSR